MEENNNQIAKPPVNGGYPLHSFSDLKNLFENYITSKSDRHRIEDAYNFILEKHKDQIRRSGEPYYHHLLEVAYIIASLQGGPSTICAGLLHDVVEDTDTPIEYIEQRFGSDVAKIVDALTKIQRLKLSKMDAEEFEAEDHRKIFLGMAQDVRVIIVKLADRLHNMRTLGALSPERQLALSRETLDVFVPICHRLGINVIKSELEDLCLKYLEPEKYNAIVVMLDKKNKTRVKSLEALTKRIADILYEHKIPFDITSRVKSIYSIYEKMYHKNHEFDEIYDVMALRIITDTDMRCYEILGLIHQTYKPIPGRFKDYIAMPKPNMYQSLHTSIVSGDGKIYEVQIRTKEMDEIACSGIAAHWAYKEGTYNAKKEQEEIENQLHWFRDFVSYSSNTNDTNAQEYMESLTLDIFGANVYIFTPKGKVLELPSGATPLDFAYRIHSKVAETAVGALVNGVMVPLNYKLKTGDVVEIKTSKNATGPNEKWLEWVSSSHSKGLIKKYLMRKNAEFMRDDNIIKGKNSCIDAFRDRGITNENEVMNYLKDEDLLQHFGFETVDDLLVAINNKKPTPNQIVEYLKLEKVNDNNYNFKYTDDDSAVYCKGAGKIAIQLASCCTPIPGDEIIGYITKGKGITVHRKDCPNISREKMRLIDVYWKDNLKDKIYPCDINIEARDRNNLLSDVLNALTGAKINYNNVHAKTNPNNFICNIAITVYVTDINRLNVAIATLSGVKDVISVLRLTH